VSLQQKTARLVPGRVLTEKPNVFNREFLRMKQEQLNSAM
jgi:hypothetical protein